MDQQGLLAAIIDARPGPADVVYVERRGDDYGLRVTGPEEDLMLGGPGAEFPDVWIYWSGDWPADDADRQSATFRDLLEELESMAGGSPERCRWPLADPTGGFPRFHH